jgi:hypothetical protein
MLRCAASFVIAAYASFLMICAPCLRNFLRSRPEYKAFATFYKSVTFELTNDTKRLYYPKMVAVGDVGGAVDQGSP